MALSLIVIDRSRVRRIIADKYGVAIGPAAAALNSLLHRARGNEGDILRQKIRRQGAQWRDVVHDPNAAAVRRQNKLVLARMNCQIANGSGREMIAFELCPVFSAVDRDPKPKLCAEKQQIRFYQVLLDDVRVATNAFDVLRSDKRRPGFPVIGRFENVRRHIAERMSIKRSVSRAGVEVAGLYPTHP